MSETKSSLNELTVDDELEDGIPEIIQSEKQNFKKSRWDISKNGEIMASENYFLYKSNS